MGRERGFSEKRISEAREEIKTTLKKLDERLKGREYLVDTFSLAYIAHAGNFVRLREFEGEGALSLADYPNVSAWVERIEARQSFKAAG